MRTAFSEINTTIAHLRDALGDQTYESLARKGETMITAATATYAYDQIDQARRAERRPRPPTLTEVKGPPDDRPPGIQSGTTTVHFAPGFDDVLVTLQALVAVLASAATRRGGHARSRSAPAGSARCSW
jgi:hypothetical protein